MASVIDLTYDGSSDENSVSPPSKIHAIKPPTTRQPLNPIQNNVQLPPIASVLPKMDLSLALTKALQSASDKRVRQLLTRLCREQPAAKALVEREFLVPSSQVVPYHADTESEDEGLDSEEGSDEENSLAKTTENQRTPILPSLKRKADDSTDHELFPRFAKCENCKEEFDVTINERGDCIWHPGSKEYNDDDGFWDDHDDDCHGDRYLLADEETYVDGYKWGCCDELGSQEGCKKTKHKAAGQPRKKSRYL